MNTIVAYGFFILGVISLFTDKDMNHVFCWFMLSGLFSIAGGIWYNAAGRKK